MAKTNMAQIKRKGMFTTSPSNMAINAHIIIAMVSQIQNNSMLSTTSFGLQVELDSIHPPFVSDSLGKVWRD